VRPKLATRPTQRQAHVPPPEGDADGTTRERFGHVPAVREDELEDPRVTHTVHAKLTDDHTPHHAAGCPHDDDHPDARPDGDAGPAHGPRGEEHQRIVVARLRSPGEP
jgi:hypothetical protein